VDRRPLRPTPPDCRFASRVISDQNARLAAAHRLTSRKGRRETGRFLVEGAQAVAAALARPGVVSAVYATAEAMARNHALLAGFDVEEISPRAAATLSETVTPQGLVAVCRLEQPSLTEVFAQAPRLLVALVEPNEPGNLGAIIRTADAAGADAVVVDGGADPYNGKAVRASAGSLFHVPVVSGSVAALLDGGHTIGMTALATTGHGGDDLDALADQGVLAEPTVWLFGTEAHGLPDTVLSAADRRVRIPIYGRAESLNLAAAAAVCLYASARAQRRQ
jgi:TrmH family RNA methyltransferase